MERKSGTYEAVVIGVSAGGIAALDTILPALSPQFAMPVIVVQHIGAGAESYLVRYFAERCRLQVREAADKEEIQAGVIYFAPPGYHLLVELQRTLALSLEAKVNYSRPSIDVLFETAALAYREKLIGIILTGANADGAAGLETIKDKGGVTIVQAPETAEAETMPRAAIARTSVDYILPLREIGAFLASLGC